MIHAKNPSPVLPLAGPSLLVIFGSAGAITVLVLRGRAASDHDGPFRKCMSNSNGVVDTGTPVDPPEHIPVVGKV